MAIEVTKTYVAEERLLLTADKSEVVKAGNIRGQYLYTVPGTRIKWDEALAYGLVEEEKPKKKKRG